MLKSGLKLFLSIAMIILFAAGCGHSSVKEVWKPYSDSEIAIGVAAPLSKFKAETKYFEGIKMAVDEVNSKGILGGKKIKLIDKDDEAELTKGTAIAQEFAEKRNVSAVIGHWNSYISVSVAPIYEKAGIVMISPGSTLPKLTQMKYKYIFRSTASDIDLARKMADTAAKRGYKRTVVFYNDDEYGRGLAHAFEEGAAKNGISVIDTLSSYNNELEFRRLAESWKAMDMDSLFIACTFSKSLEDLDFIRLVRKEGIDVPILGGDGLDYKVVVDTLGGLADGILVPTAFNRGYADPDFQSFISKFLAIYRCTPDSKAMRGYETVKILAYAMEKCGSANPADIAKTLHEMKGWKGITGNLSYDENGEVHGNMTFVSVVKNGAFQIYNTD